MKYRPEVDGLRAVAVVPVILFHAGLPGFSGGFVGVDVFFVISGYLITAILVSDLAQGRFSLARFYERRARRILPALFVVMAASVPFAYAWMMPQQYEAFSASLLAVALFGANILFWREDGYFAAAAELKPMLHTWSLAVEEQFYLVFPLLLMALWARGSRRLIWVVALIALCSLALSEIGLRLPQVSDAAVFYLLPTRAWELLAGALCALVAMRVTRFDGWLAALGLAMIALSVAIFDHTTPFPSIWALLPVVGTVLVLRCARAETVAGRLLSLRPFVWIGLISYSAYLWHQPLFAFARIRSFDPPSMAVMLGLSVVSLGLAWLTWRFVEQPFRRHKGRVLTGQAQVFGWSLAGLVAFAAVGTLGWQGNGLPQRLPPEALRFAEAELDRNPYLRDCNLSIYAPPPAHPFAPCSDFLIDGSADVVIMGDSHSHAIAFETATMLQAEGLGTYFLSYGGCPVLPGFVRADRRDSQQCNAYIDSMLAYMRDNQIGTVIIAARFTQQLEGTGFDNGEGGVEHVSGAYIDQRAMTGEVGAQADPVRRTRVLEGWRTELRALVEEFNVILVHPIPEAGWNVPRTLVHRTLYGDGIANPLTTDAARVLARNQPVNDLFGSIDHPNLYRVNPYDVFCDTKLAGRCVNEWDGDVLYFDDDHLSNAGARWVADAIRPVIRGIFGAE